MVRDPQTAQSGWFIKIDDAYDIICDDVVRRIEAWEAWGTAYTVTYRDAYDGAALGRALIALGNQLIEHHAPQLKRVETVSVFDLDASQPGDTATRD